MRKFEITLDEINNIIGWLEDAPTKFGFKPVLLLQNIAQTKEIVEPVKQES
jgi:hypothetical protein